MGSTGSSFLTNVKNEVLLPQLHEHQALIHNIRTMLSLAVLRPCDEAQVWLPCIRSNTPRIANPSLARAIMVSSIPEEFENVKIAKSTLCCALRICFIISSSGVWSGPNIARTRIPEMRQFRGVSSCRLRRDPNVPFQISSNSYWYSLAIHLLWITTIWFKFLRSGWAPTPKQHFDCAFSICRNWVGPNAVNLREILLVNTGWNRIIYFCAPASMYCRWHSNCSTTSR